MKILTSLKTKKSLEQDFLQIVEAWSSELVTDLINAHPLELVAHSHMIQYASVWHMRKLYNEMYELYTMLDNLQVDSKDIINIGTGVGILEWICLQHDFPIITCDILCEASFSRGKQNYDPYEVVRKYLGVEVDYRIENMYSDHFKLNSNYTVGVANRFLPIQYDDYETTFEKLKPYVDILIVSHREVIKLK